MDWNLLVPDANLSPTRCWARMCRRAPSTLTCAHTCVIHVPTWDHACSGSPRTCLCSIPSPTTIDNMIVWTVYQISEAQGISTSAVLKPHRPSRTIHTKGQLDRSKTGGVDDLGPRSWIYTSTHAPLTKQEDKAARDTQEATLAEAIRALSTISNHEIVMLISKPLRGYE